MVSNATRRGLEKVAGAATQLGAQQDALQQRQTAVEHHLLQQPALVQ